MTGPKIPKPPEWFKEFQEINRASASAGQDPRRRHPRFEIDASSVTLYRGGLLASLGWGRNNFARGALDLSEGGAHLLLDRRVPPGTRVRVRIDMERYQDTLEVSAVVRWCHENARKKGEFHAGVMFLKLDDAQRRKLARMRDWFTSPQYKALRENRQRQKGPEIIFPK